MPAQNRLKFCLLRPSSEVFYATFVVGCFIQAWESAKRPKKAGTLPLAPSLRAPKRVSGERSFGLGSTPLVLALLLVAGFTVNEVLAIQGAPEVTVQN